MSYPKDGVPYQSECIVKCLRPNKNWISLQKFELFEDHFIILCNSNIKLRWSLFVLRCPSLYDPHHFVIRLCDLAIPPLFCNKDCINLY